MILGVTGRIATGKTTLSKILENMGFVRIDADEIYRILRKESNELNNGLLKRFGTLDNREILNMVRQDSGALSDLNNITHGFVVREMKRIIDGTDGDVVLDVPVPVEIGFLDTAEYIIATDCCEKTQAERIMERDGCGLDEAMAKINLQESREYYFSIADSVISTEGMTSADLGKTAAEIVGEMRKGI